MVEWRLFRIEIISFSQCTRKKASWNIQSEQGHSRNSLVCEIAWSCTHKKKFILYCICTFKIVCNHIKRLWFVSHICCSLFPATFFYWPGDQWVRKLMVFPRSWGSLPHYGIAFTRNKSQRQILRYLTFPWSHIISLREVLPNEKYSFFNIVQKAVSPLLLLNRMPDSDIDAAVDGTMWMVSVQYGFIKIC